MHFDLDLVGAFVPGIALWLLAGLLVFLGLDALLTRWGFYRLFWHPPLARFALFGCLFSGLGLLLASM
jgi:protein AaeX